MSLTQTFGAKRALEDDHWVGPASGRPSAVTEELVSKRVRAYVGLGSNVGDSRSAIQNAVRALAALPGARLRGVSRLYRTKPVGVTDQPDFLNAVAALDVPAGPDAETGALALVSALKQIEAALGRQPRHRWGPREIDLDLLVFGRHQVMVERSDGRWLEVPHPLARERLFVLAPLSDLAPGLRPPGWGESVETARRRQEKTEGGGAAMRAAGLLSPPVRQRRRCRARN